MGEFEKRECFLYKAKLAVLVFVPASLKFSAIAAEAESAVEFSSSYPKFNSSNTFDNKTVSPKWFHSTK
jgi:hypothetical protein